MTVRPWNFPERLRFATGRKNDVPCSLERNLKSLQGVSVILDDEYAQGIEIRSVSSHTVWGIGSRDPACRDKLTRAVENESCSPLQLPRSSHATCRPGPQTVAFENR